MIRRRARFAVQLAGLAGLVSLALFASLAAWAQADDAEPASEEDDPRPLDEIVVTAEKPGDRTDLETPYEELMRQRLLEEMDTMRREQDEFEWRRGPVVSQPSRISFGYRPQDRARDERDSSLTRLPMENTRPATVFRFEF